METTQKLLDTHANELRETALELRKVKHLEPDNTRLIQELESQITTLKGIIITQIGNGIVNITKQINAITAEINTRPSDQDFVEKKRQEIQHLLHEITVWQGNHTRLEMYE